MFEKKKKETSAQSTKPAQSTQPTQPTNTEEAMPEKKTEEAPAESTAMVPAEHNSNPLFALVKPETISEKYRELVVAQIEAMNPDKRGFEENATYGWTAPVIKIRHGLTRSAPDNCKIGGLFTSDGDLVAEPFRFTPIYVYKSHLEFAPGGDANITCSSDDTVISRFGTQCAQCDRRPFKDGKPSSCNVVINALVMGSDLKLYMIWFSKTSFKAGSQLIRFSQATKLPWNRWYSLTVGKDVNKSKQEFYVFKTSSTGEAVPDDLQVVCDRFNVIIEKFRKDTKERNAKRITSAHDTVDKLDGASDEGDDGVVDGNVAEPNFDGKI